MSNACLEVPELTQDSGTSSAIGADASSVDGGHSENEEGGMDDAGDGKLELTGSSWLSTSSIIVNFSDVTREGEPFIAIYPEQAAAPVRSFVVPFAEQELVTSGTHAFDPLPVGNYMLRLVRDVNRVQQAIAFSVRDDSDGDGTADDKDGCPIDPDKLAPGLCGCGVSDDDADGDGTAACIDQCPNDANKAMAGGCGCGVSDDDSDGDGTPDCVDECDNDANKTAPGMCNCGVAENDADGDNAPDCVDGCPANAGKTAPGVCGCATADTDTDGDGTRDCQDQCPVDPNKIAAGTCGCGIIEGNCASTCSSTLLPDQDMMAGAKRCSPNGQFSFGLSAEGNLTFREGNEVVWSAYQSGAAVKLRLQGSDGNLVARTAASAAVWASGITGKGGAILDVEDNGAVVVRHNGTVVWSVGPFRSGNTLCREARENQSIELACPAGQDISGVQFASYGKPTGACGTYAIDNACHTAAESFVDMECVGESSCQFVVDKAKFGIPCSGTKRLLVAYTCTGDGCPDDPAKDAPGACGCGVADTDSDSDGSPNCVDACPDNAGKTAPGVCGCAQADTDGDSDGTVDCQDQCPSDPSKVVPGTCGCGVAEGTCAPACSNQLLPSTQLAPNETRCSQNGEFNFGLDSAGYLQLRKGSEVVWSAFQTGAAVFVRLQSDGNLVARAASNAAVWSSVTSGKNGSILTVENDGSVVLRQLDVTVWSIGPFESGETRCREARENQTAALSCPAGQTISGFSFASYGRPAGTCGNLTIDNTCHYSAQSFLETECVGENSCDFVVNTANFTIPCSGTKKLVVAYTCIGDQCPADPNKVTPGACGCGVSDADGDSDGTADCLDACPADANKLLPGACGCGNADTDGDSDGTADCLDACPADANKLLPGVCGCGNSDADSDTDGTADCLDACPSDPTKLEAGICGCGVSDEDLDNDGNADCTDACPGDLTKAEPGICGCGVSDADSDSDGTADCLDGCPSDLTKLEPGVCGCGVSDADGDSDGTADCLDGCPSDLTKLEPGVCGCGVSDVDGDSDGTADCLDACPSDATKLEPGVCGCGVADVDSDSDGTADCADQCAADPAKTAPGACGCGIDDSNCPPACASDLQPNAQMLVGEKRCSANGLYQFGLGADGYLTLRQGSEVIWTGFQTGAAVSIRLQGDGNLVARNAANASVWSSGTAGKTGAVLTVENDGSVVLRHLGLVVWSVGPFQSGTTRCREARENQMAHLTCPAGQTIQAFSFASYGKPTGVCGSLAIDNACNFSAQSYVDTNCVGTNTCDFLVDKAKFTIPCSGTKRLVVAYSCSGN